ncbi:hypothetical protein DIPPA_28828 [Diplonema papillatum]|nr:hypothetical protein DIPPA_28828 [Diplonema papillatum]
MQRRLAGRTDGACAARLRRLVAGNSRLQRSRIVAAGLGELAALRADRSAEVGEKSYGVVLAMLGRWRCPGPAWGILREMKADRVPPTLECYRHLARACRTVDEVSRVVDEVQQVFGEAALQRRGHGITAMVARLLHEERDTATANQLLTGIPPECHTGYTAGLLIETQPTVAAAFAAFDRTPAVTRSPQALAHYNALLHVCARCGDAESAEAVFFLFEAPPRRPEPGNRQQRASGRAAAVKPSRVSWQRLMRAYIVAFQKKHGFDVFASGGQGGEGPATCSEDGTADPAQDPASADCEHAGSTHRNGESNATCGHHPLSTICSEARAADSAQDPASADCEHAGSTRSGGDSDATHAHSTICSEDRTADSAQDPASANCERAGSRTSAAAEIDAGDASCESDTGADAASLINDAGDASCASDTGGPASLINDAGDASCASDTGADAASLINDAGDASCASDTGADTASLINDAGDASCESDTGGSASLINDTGDASCASDTGGPASLFKDAGDSSCASDTGGSASLICDAGAGVVVPVEVHDRVLAVLARKEARGEEIDAVDHATVITACLAFLRAVEQTGCGQSAKGKVQRARQLAEAAFHSVEVRDECREPAAYTALFRVYAASHRLGDGDYARHAVLLLDLYLIRCKRIHPPVQAALAEVARTCGVSFTKFFPDTRRH